MFGRGKRLPAEVRRLRLEPGDVLVIQCKGRITEAASDALVKRFGSVIPEHRCIAIDSAADLSVLTPFDSGALARGTMAYSHRMTAAQIAEAKERFLSEQSEPPRVMS